MATAHLLFGYLGAGKTTLARKLEQQHAAVRFTPDEWMAGLFGSDPPADTFAAHAEAILAMLEPVWLRCLGLGVDVVLDYGFWSRAERDHVRGLVEQSGSIAILYVVDCSEAEARLRVHERNLRPERSLYIAPGTFDALKGRFEPLQQDEAYTPIC